MISPSTGVVQGTDLFKEILPDLYYYKLSNTQLKTLLLRDNIAHRVIIS